jgi:hypothetical protein
MAERAEMMRDVVVRRRRRGGIERGADTGSRTSPGDSRGRRRTEERARRRRARPAGIKPTAHLMGSYIAADPTGRTPVRGVWVAANSTDLSAQVSAAAADGARAAAHINADLVAEDTDRAVAQLSNAEVTR